MTESRAAVCGQVRTVAEWLRANDIAPVDVPVDSEISIEPEPSGGGRRIRYSALLRNELGHLHHDPATGGPAVEIRTAALKVEPPEDVYVSYESRGATLERV